MTPTGKKAAAAANDASTAAGSSGPERGMWVEQTQPPSSSSRLNCSRPSQYSDPDQVTGSQP